MEPVTNVPDDLELSLLVLKLLPRELSNFESFADPTFETCVCSGSEFRSDACSPESLRTWSPEVKGYDGSFGVMVELLDGGGSYVESLCIADPEGELGPMLGSG